MRSTGVVNHSHVYAVASDFGPVFLKFCSYLTYHARLCINGREWANRQAAKTGLQHSALEIGFATAPTEKPSMTRAA